MPFPIQSSAETVDRVAAQVSANFLAVKTALQVWRGDVERGRISGSGSREVYQSVLSARNFAAAQVGRKRINAAFVRNNPDLPDDFDFATALNEPELAIQAFASWFRMNWPQTTKDGCPAFEGYNAVSGELETLDVRLRDTERAELLARIDAVLAAFG